MTEIQWESPPPRGRGRPIVDWDTIAAALKTDPERRWVRAGAYVSRASAATMARLINTGKIAALARVGTFEATSRTVDGEFRVYVRYTGEATP